MPDSIFNTFQSKKIRASNDARIPVTQLLSKSFQVAPGWDLLEQFRLVYQVNVRTLEACELLSFLVVN